MSKAVGKKGFIAPHCPDVFDPAFAIFLTERYLQHEKCPWLPLQWLKGEQFVGHFLF
jgi:hypothetical protein